MYIKLWRFTRSVQKKPGRQKMNIFDPYHSFPKYIKEVLHKSWKSVQNPSERDATFRNKTGKKYTGYVVNTVEARDREKKMSMI
ncbi:MAG: hypothetical protein PWR14_788 [Thermosediminibacterales bacterium]|nr:hypothetical protein [Thermosediminibacterales bacterium]